ncbi:trypsin-like peptidase domain-containing protein [Candidatus Parcubacteria bacterium]|nr:trypsin-like peptidase domain-containing protein [Candidatus Parcubacteria bacterium]
MYEIPKFNLSKLRRKPVNGKKFKTLRILILCIFVSSLFGGAAGIASGLYFYNEIKEHLSDFNIEIPDAKIIEKETIIEKAVEKAVEKEYIPQTSVEEKIIKVVEESSPAVVSIIITKDVPVMEKFYYSPFGDNFLQVPQYRQKGTQKQKIGGGTGFIVSENGMIITNKHVVLDDAADYTVFTNDGAQYSAKVLAKDTIQDIAVIKIEPDKNVNNTGGITIDKFPMLEFGDSSSLQIGQTVIAIGNALGEFRNTVSVGVISGLGRTITASGGGLVETLEDVIQTDAAINKGNSGGPLLNLRGQVIGINTAVAQAGAENIGFAIPANCAKKDLQDVQKYGRIKKAFLGVRYALLTEAAKQQYDLPVDYGILVVKGSSGEQAIAPNSPADKAGLREGDIILEFNNEKITLDNSLVKIILKYNPGDTIKLKILRPENPDEKKQKDRHYKEKTIWVMLDERVE